MQNKMTGALGRKRWRLIGWGLAFLLFILPAIAMQFTGEVNWGTMDFIVFGTLILIAGTGIELASRFIRKKSTRIAATLAILAGFLIIWASLAVDLIP